MNYQIFEYGGFHFIPERRFTADENRVGDLYKLIPNTMEDGR